MYLNNFFVIKSGKNRAPVKIGGKLFESPDIKKAPIPEVPRL